MSIIKFNDLDEVIERANRTMYGLAAAVWTRDVSKALAVANGVRAGTVWVNCYDVFDPGSAIRRVQAIRNGPRNGRIRPATVHRGQDGNRKVVDLRRR